MDIPSAEAAGIIRDYLNLNARDSLLIFWDESRLESPDTVFGDVKLEFSILAFQRCDF